MALTVDRYDDLIPEDNDTVQLALKRLPPKEAYDRMYRIRRAVQVSACPDTTTSLLSISTLCLYEACRLTSDSSALWNTSFCQRRTTPSQKMYAYIFCLFLLFFSPFSQKRHGLTVCCRMSDTSPPSSRPSSVRMPSVSNSTPSSSSDEFPSDQPGHPTSPSMPIMP